MLTLFNNNRYYRRRNRNVIAIILYLLGIMVLTAVDQFTKLWVVSRLAGIGSMPVIGNFIKFSYAENTGAAFSTLQGQRVLLIAVPALLSAVCIGVIISRYLDSVLGNVSLMLIAAGGIGNLIDRITRGYVVDFIDFNAIHFAIFNVADSCVTIGVVLLLIFVLIRESNLGRRKSKSDIFTRRRF